nr:signal recognition particle-docking protein FtsY [Aureimonas fodinaquatilis]
MNEPVADDEPDAPAPDEVALLPEVTEEVAPPDTAEDIDAGAEALPFDVAIDDAEEAIPAEDLPLPPEDAAEDEFSWLNQPVEPGDDDIDGETPYAAPAVAGAVPASNWLQRLSAGLARSSGQLSGQITDLFTKRKLDEDTLQDFEDVLIQADFGPETAMRITDRLSDGRFGKDITGEAVRNILAEEVEKALTPVARPLELDLSVKPHVILVVGVNGTGKTTTIGKLAAKLTQGGLKVTLGAGDTFRAAAVEQLKIWGERTGSAVVAKAIGADAAGLVYEAYDEAVRNGSDVLIIDTAGRLQNKTELMAELEKIVRVLQKRVPDAPHTVLQTLDATTGQNALNQVEIFRNVAGVNGLVMTKLDGTARGGILVAIAAKHRLPVYFIGVGEGIDDLEPFKANEFAAAIAGRATS